MFSKYATFPLLALIASLTVSSPAAADDADRWLFRVYLDDREIGFHEFSVRERDGRFDVETTANFDVNILFFNAYSYNHKNRETWSGNCLEGIEAVTDDNGNPATDDATLTIDVTGILGLDSHLLSRLGIGRGLALEISHVGVLQPAQAGRQGHADGQPHRCRGGKHLRQRGPVQGRHPSRAPRRTYQ